jgi:hypothetical protein
MEAEGGLGARSRTERRLQTASVRPPARMGHGFAVLQDQLYVFGGRGDAGKELVF